jgi:hypothetical protein
MFRRTPGTGFFAAIHRRELAVVFWLWPQIDDRERAGKALGYARRGAIVATVLVLVPVFFPEGFDQEKGWFLSFDLAALLDAVLLVQLALYVYVYVVGYKRWEAITGALALFVLAYFVLPMIEDEQSWFAIFLGLYAVRCFAIGLKSRRLLDRLDAGGGPQDGAAAPGEK